MVLMTCLNPYFLDLPAVIIKTLRSPLPHLLLMSPKSPFCVSSLVQLAGCLASLMILLVILATGFLFESLPQVCSLDVGWSFSMCRDFSILFVCISVTVSWVFTVTLAGWCEKGQGWGQDPAPQSTVLPHNLGSWESHLNISGCPFPYLQSGGLDWLISKVPSLFDLLWPYTSIKNLRWPSLLRHLFADLFNLVEIRNDTEWRKS